MNLTPGAVLALIGCTALVSTPALRTDRAYRVATTVGLVLVVVGLAIWWPSR